MVATQAKGFLWGDCIARSSRRPAQPKAPGTDDEESTRRQSEAFFLHAPPFIHYSILLRPMVFWLTFAALADYNCRMNESGKESLIGKKTYEIAYALWRIANYTQEKVFADILRNRAMEMIDFAANAKYAALDTAMDSLHAIIKFAVDVNCITIGNAAILAKESGNLKSAIGNNHPEYAVDISDIFSSEKIAKEDLPEDLPIEVVLENESGKKKAQKGYEAVASSRKSLKDRLAAIEKHLGVAA